MFLSKLLNIGGFPTTRRSMRSPHPNEDGLVADAIVAQVDLVVVVQIVNDEVREQVRCQVCIRLDSDGISNDHGRQIARSIAARIPAATATTCREGKRSGQCGCNEFAGSASSSTHADHSCGATQFTRCLHSRLRERFGITLQTILLISRVPKTKEDPAQRPGLPQLFSSA